MIQIDMEMPKSCDKCPFQGETYHGCPLVSGVVAWQIEIADKCKDKRSEHCPLIEV